MQKQKSVEEDKRYNGRMKNDDLYIEYDYLIKMVVVGDSGVGKSQLVARFSRGEFTHKSRQTIGVEFATKTVEVEEKQICCQLWDTAGEERYRALASAYYRGSVGVLLVYDVTNPRSFKNLAYWLSEIKAYSSEDCQTMLVGNKTDLSKQRKVEKPEAQQFAEQNKLAYIETSALKSTNVEAAFIGLINQIYIKNISSGKFSSATNANNSINLSGREVENKNNKSVSQLFKDNCCNS